ncbi:4-hydroxy-4-methyl-2-oxoglutarate aldolase/4-carboxy-4-hydroxy-2-oxoadipate aldolase [Pseudomonas sp. Bi70]|jgi:regulator of RNase E activity RraA|uniref:RraA family protein n=1 Tax=unclassified Pseudomonas TaxID=196821 RepID=UPI000DAC073E|nr:MULTISPECIES: RraA family protein [unclassified Pseudomonas]MBD9653196.1 RraA family protein [Pseudomonas sp. PDM12]PZW50257.1 regulator of RNase E activity RraA [Pseudomonas sp. URMO17WK12:I2]CAH0305662.1 4-hydroxy-4-methyl-2-oxoglutarate aldolase/4-carboxy-4-hydroxy-2-oxoadipate aldolase [Pseudomonas sp. Bi70]
MYIIEALPEAINPEELSVLLRAEPATIGHFITTGIVSPQIRAHFENVRTVGTAVTVKMPGADGGILHYAMGCARPGDFLVVDRCGESVTAAMGGAMAYAAKQAGIAGIIIDGYVTDLGELRQHGVPVWSWGASAITTRVKGEEGEFCTAVQCGGVVVRPGDAVIADENGIVILPPAQALVLARRAIEFQENEKHTLARLAQGEKFPDVVGSRSVIDAAIDRAR